MKKIHVLLIVLAVAAGFLLWTNDKVKSRLEGNRMNKYTVKLPSSFPKDFPLDVTAAPATANELPDNTIMFKTNLLPSQALSVYADYANTHKWQIVSKRVNPFISSISIQTDPKHILGIVIQLGSDQKGVVTAVMNRQ